MVGAFRCPACGAATWGALKHCPRCGEPLNTTCPECGGTWRYIYDEDYRFCPSCGARTPRLSQRLEG